MNKVMLIGHLGGDPTKNAVNNDTSVVNFSLATTERFKTKNGEKKETTEWHRIVCWNEGLNNTIMNILKKGHKVCVVGKINTNKWLDAEGAPRDKKEVVLKEIEFLERRKDEVVPF